MASDFFKRPSTLIANLHEFRHHLISKQSEVWENPSEKISWLSQLVVKILKQRHDPLAINNPNYQSAIWFLVAEVYWQAMLLAKKNNNVSLQSFNFMQIMECIDWIDEIYLQQKSLGQEPDYSLIASFNSFGFSSTEKARESLIKYTIDSGENIASKSQDITSAFKP